MSSLVFCQFWVLDNYRQTTSSIEWIVDYYYLMILSHSQRSSLIWLSLVLFVKEREYVNFKAVSLYIVNQNVPCRWDCVFSSKLCAVMNCRHAPTNAFCKCCWFYLKKMYLFSLKIKYLFKQVVLLSVIECVI